MAAGRTADSRSPRTGRVVDQRGEPVAAAFVSIVESTVPMPEIALVADADGNFALNLPPGRFTLRATATPGVGETAVDATKPDDEIVIVVER